MLKRFIAIFSIICAGFVLGSCSDSLDRTSSVSFKLSDSFFREALNSSVSDSSAGDISDEPAAAEEYIVKVTVNWDNGNRFDKRTVVLKEDGKIDCPEFTFDDLPVGKTVKIDVSISCGDKTIYSREEPFEITLNAGKNECTVELKKQVADVSISISIENKDFLKLDSSYKLAVEITDSSNKTAKSEYPVCDENTYKIAENKLIGETLEISVSVYNNSLCLYKTLEPLYIAVAKENNVQVTLSNAVSTAAVWQNRMSGNSYELFQNKSYKDSQETDSLEDLNYSGMYTFDCNGNLWTVTVDANANANAMNFRMYEMNSNELIYNSDVTKSYSIDLKDVSEEPVDIYWDDDILYILFNDNDDSENPYNVKSYKIEAESFSLKSEVDLTGIGTNEPVTLAVHDKTIIVASRTVVYYAISESENSGELVDLSKIINESKGSIPPITDLQFGDGLGNDTDKLYVLVRDCSSSISNSDEEQTYYSSGALVEIDLESKNFKQYGNAAENNTVQITDTEKNTAKDVVLVSPVDDSNFFGPYKFVALAPRKLVILDDGVSVDTDNKKLTNHDNLFEFDIAEKAITKGESVSASVPDVISMAADWKN